jgi:PAS domain S-box-containing protein
LASPSRLSRPLAATAGGSLVVCVAVYALGPADRWYREVIADASWTWSALLAVVCCALAARRAQGEERRAWRWIAIGCASFLLGQLVWNYYELWRHVRPPYPSLADLGFLGIYPCFIVAVLDLLGLQPDRHPDPEVALDAGLVTFTAAALAYEFLLAPILQTGEAVLPVATSVAWASGGVAVLWAILRQMVRRRGFPVGTAGLLTVGLVIFCATNLVYARVSLRGTFASGGVLDLGWDAGLLLIAAAAALAPEQWSTSDDTARGLSSDATRAIAVLVAVAGIAVLAIVGAARPQASAVTAIWVAVGIAILGARFVYALRSERGYARLLEREVAAQTRSLLDSLAATGAAERNLRLVMEAVPDALVVLDPDGRTLEMNSAARAMFAAQPEASPERSLFDTLDPEGLAIARQNLDAALQGEVRTFELSFRREAGRRGTGAVLYAPVRDGPRVSKVLALIRDVTDQKRRESQLQQAEKLGAIGQLVSGVAHEINNPAAIISGSAQTMLLDDLKPEHREMAQMIYDEATRIGRITQNLLAFARAGGKERTLIDLNDIVRRTVALRAYHLSTVNVAVILDLDPTHPKIWSNASELQQMLLNLVINAEQAVLTVEPPRTITVRSRASERDVRLEVADNGPGVPLEIRNRVFDPFFTTKPEGVGTGLGLSICYGIVRDHGGRIWVEPEPGQGARFLVELPRDPRTHARPASETRISGVQERRLNVLLVEDETGLRNALLHFLARRGIDATAAGDGAEALRVLKQQSFDVIVSDVRMPGMNGRDFLRQLRIDRPELVSRVIFSTGDAHDDDTAALIRESGAPTVSKPFDLMSLERLVREVALRPSVASTAPPMTRA